jgi:hypothetical protein
MNSQRPRRNGWQFDCWTGDPIAARAVPAHAEAVAVGRLGAHPGVQALVDDPVR